MTRRTPAPVGGHRRASMLLIGLRALMGPGKKGMFVSMPRQLGKDGKWYDHVVTLSDDTRKAVGQVVLAAYQQELASPTCFPLDKVSVPHYILLV